jgi:REP element-mobilizing transposase RayT
MNKAEIPGSANLPIGDLQITNSAIAENGEPGGENSGPTNHPIGDSQIANSAVAENGEPGGELPGNANLPIGGAENASTKSANQEIGEPRASYWHSRGYLPHFESAEKIQHVTFHLADSLPKAALARLEEKLSQLPTEQQDAERRKRIEALRDAGYGACVLREPGIAEMVQNTLFFFDGQRYNLLAWVVMPNHVHVLFQTMPGWTVAKIVASWKKFTARKICDYQKAIPGHANLQIGEITQSAIQENGEPRSNTNRIWQREYWDRFIRNEKHLCQVILYIHQNPVKAGLVATAESWRWSSAYPGNANLQISEVDKSSDQSAKQNADQSASQTANQEIGDPRKTREKP